MTSADNQSKPATIKLPEGLLERIVAHLDPQRVYLFGSQARGDTHKDSDWDFLVVVDDDVPNERINWLAMYEARRGIRGVAIDILPVRATEFERRKTIVGALPRTVMKEGVVVYERAAKS